MRVAILGISLLALTYIQATSALGGPKQFTCGETECDCFGNKDCRDMNKSGMCGGQLICTTILNNLSCRCDAAAQTKLDMNTAQKKKKAVAPE